MIIRDGRREVHDLGARRTWEPSMMKMLGGLGSTGNGRWTSPMMTFMVDRPKRVYIYVPVNTGIPCESCGGEVISAQPSRARFCSDRCRNKEAKRAWRARQ